MMLLIISVDVNRIGERTLPWSKPFFCFSTELVSIYTLDIGVYINMIIRCPIIYTVEFNLFCSHSASDNSISTPRVLRVEWWDKISITHLNLIFKTFVEFGY